MSNDAYTRLENVQLRDLKPGDRCYLLGTPDVSTVINVQHIPPCVIIDFNDGTSTPPMGGSITIDVVHRPHS
jgi:hypothetical protein